MNLVRRSLLGLGGVVLSTMFLLPKTASAAEPLDVTTLGYQRTLTADADIRIGDAPVRNVTHRRWGYGYRSNYGGYYSPRYYGYSSYRPRYYGYSSYRPRYYGYSSYRPRYYGYSYYAPRYYRPAYYQRSYAYRGYGYYGWGPYGCY
jgi:hypothetical protein